MLPTNYKRDNDSTRLLSINNTKSDDDVSPKYGSVGGAKQWVEGDNKGYFNSGEEAMKRSNAKGFGGTQNGLVPDWAVGGDFSDELNFEYPKTPTHNKEMRTGRQRKKIAARSRGGEFMSKKNKRKTYFHCISSEINIDELLDHFNGSSGVGLGAGYAFCGNYGLVGTLYSDVLHLHVPYDDFCDFDQISSSDNAADISRNAASDAERRSSYVLDELSSQSNGSSSYSNGKSYRLNSIINPIKSITNPISHPSSGGSLKTGNNNSSNELNAQEVDIWTRQRSRVGSNNSTSQAEIAADDLLDGAATININTVTFASNLTTSGPSITSDSFDERPKYSNKTRSQSVDMVDNFSMQPSSPKPPIYKADSSATLYRSNQHEVFVFEFGAVVFWGFHKGEEAGIRNIIERFIRKGKLSPEEVAVTEDDMAFIVSEDEPETSIANDVITLPSNSGVKDRLAVSFAIAQSAVLSLFEARIERRVAEYKYIPETLATCGKLRLSPKQLGNMIGEVFVIRHDVNLNTEILDTPDIFWKEDHTLSVFNRIYVYLEMENRTNVLNTRLNMLKDLLSVLQQQHESSHSSKLEWIVIWLIVISVGVELVSIAFQVL